jgi:hypothetical protein
LGGRLVAVTVQQEPASTAAVPTAMTVASATLARRLAIVTPRGLRVEGLDIDDAVALVRALG